MASTSNKDDGTSPWLSWAMTGVLTLAAVLIFGLVVSAKHPRAQAALPTATEKDANDSAAAPIGSASPPASSAVLSSATAPRGSANGIAADSSAAAQLPAKPQAANEVDPAPAPPAASAKADPPPAASPQATKPQEPVNPVANASGAPPAARKAGPAAADPAKLAAFVKAVAAVRKAMAQRDLTASKRYLRTAAANAQSTAEQGEADRLQILQDHVEKFWTGIRDAVSKLETAEEIVISERNRVAVIEASRDELSVQIYGQPHRYRIEAIPMELLSAIAKSNIQATADSKLIVGQFLAMDALGDRAEARKLWREAIAAGEDEGKQLMPELDVPRAAAEAQKNSQ